MAQFPFQVLTNAGRILHDGLLKTKAARELEKAIATPASPDSPFNTPEAKIERTKAALRECATAGLVSAHELFHLGVDLPEGGAAESVPKKEEDCDPGLSSSVRSLARFVLLPGATLDLLGGAGLDAVETALRNDAKGGKGAGALAQDATHVSHPHGELFEALSVDDFVAAEELEVRLICRARGHVR